MSEELINESEELEERRDDERDDDYDTNYEDDDFDEDIPAADDYDEEDEGEEDEEESDVTYVEGPAVFARTRETGGGPGGRRRNLRSLAREVNLEDVDYKRVQILSRFVDRHGRILSRRKTRIGAKMQRKITREIKRARHLALMPYTREHVRVTRKRSS